MKLNTAQFNKVVGLAPTVDKEILATLTKEEASDVIDSLVKTYRTYEDYPIDTRVQERTTAVNRLIRQMNNKYSNRVCTVCGGAKVPSDKLDACHCD